MGFHVDFKDGPTNTTYRASTVVLTSLSISLYVLFRYLDLYIEAPNSPK